MKGRRRPPLQHPLAPLFARAIDSFSAALNPESIRHYHGTARSFLSYLGANYPEVHRLDQLRRHLRAQTGHPAEDVGLTPQLVEAMDLGVIRAEIAEEVARSPVVVTNAFGLECSTERIDSTGEERSQRMLK